MASDVSCMPCVEGRHQWCKGKLCRCYDNDPGIHPNAR